MPQVRGGEVILLAIFVLAAAQVLGRALFVDTEARESAVWEACVRP